MNPNHKQMIATHIRDGRLAKGYTQKELSELSNVSVRSIQRIENAELVPRSYTLKTLASILDLPFDSFLGETPAPEEKVSNPSKLSRGQKIILSVGVSIAILLLAAAFLAQLPRFPETSFEAFNAALVVVLLITAVLFLTWKKN
jgi:transcriptional regulator with XRE-family HTH domain